MATKRKGPAVFSGDAGSHHKSIGEPGHNGQREAKGVKKEASGSISPRRDRPIGIRGLVVDELERVDLGKMNLQLIANEQNQDRA